VLLAPAESHPRSIEISGLIHPISGLLSSNDYCGDRQGEEKDAQNDGNLEKRPLNTTPGCENAPGIRPCQTTQAGAFAL